MAEEPGEEQVRRELEEELRRLKIADVVVQTFVSISSLCYRKLSPDERDLDDARLGIEALRALAPVLSGAVPEEVARDLRQAVDNLQLAYAKAVAGGS